jgi:hypothetical protein
MGNNPVSLVDPDGRQANRNGQNKDVQYDTGTLFGRDATNVKTSQPYERVAEPANPGPSVLDGIMSGYKPYLPQSLEWYARACGRADISDIQPQEILLNVAIIFRSLTTSAAKTSTGALDGSFSVFNWKGYPAGGVKPTGPFRLLEGAEYTSARNLANSTNLTMRRANPEMFKGLQIHEIHPVKFGGSPTSLSNKVFLTPAQHAEYTNFWNSLLRSTK